MSSGSRPGAADKKVVPEGTAIDTPEFTNIETVRTKPSVAKNSKGSARFGSANEAETESSKLFREETEKPEEENARAMEDLSTNLATAPCIIDPDSPHMRRWDLFIMALLVYTAFVTPYEVGVACHAPPPPPTRPSFTTQRHFLNCCLMINTGGLHGD
jgi:hypothetical protein